MKAVVTLADVREARGIVAELAAANPLLQPVFDRLDREYAAMRAGANAESSLQRAARRSREARELI